MKYDFLDDILEEDFKNLAIEKSFGLEEHIKKINSKLVVKKKSAYQKIMDWFDWNKHEALGLIISSIAIGSVNLISYRDLYANNLLKEVSLKNFFVPSNSLYYFFDATLLLLPSYFNFIKNSEYFSKYLKKKNYIDFKALLPSLVFLGLGLYAADAIKKDEFVNGMKYLKESVLAFSMVGSYLFYQTAKVINNFFDKSKNVLYDVVLKKDLSKISDEKLRKELDRLEMLEKNYIPSLSYEKLSYYFELYKRGLIDFKSFTREISLLKNRFSNNKKDSFLIVFGYLSSRWKELFVKEYKDESSEMNRLLYKISFLKHLDKLLFKIFDKKINEKIYECITKTERIILNTNNEGCDLAAMLFRSLFTNKAEDWKNFVEKIIDTKQYVIDKKTKHSITLHLKDDLFSTDVFECKILKSENELESLINEYLDITFAYRTFSEELNLKPNNSVVEELFLGKINFEGRDSVAMVSLRRIIGKTASDLLRETYNEKPSVIDENISFIREIVNFQKVLTKRFYNEKYRILKEFNNEEYFNEKFFSRLENLIAEHSAERSMCSKELLKILNNARNNKALKEFFELEREVNNSKWYVVVHGDAVTSNIIRYLKENKKIKIEFTTFYDFKLMLASPNFDIYSFTEDQRNLLCDNEKTQIIRAAYEELLKNKLFRGDENDFLKSYLLIQNLRDCCTGVMFIDYSLNSRDEQEKRYFLEMARYFLNRNLNNNYLFNKKIRFTGTEANVLLNYENEILKIKKEILNAI
ncbi:MAG: hypothetical protein ACP5OZ_04225 [Candidatus Woesearchaeota archaeon]